MRPRSLWLLSLLILLSGCAGRPAPVADPVPAPPAEFRQLQGQASQPAATTPWWESFDDPALAELMAVAFADNLDLAQAVARLEQSEALLRTARAGLLPRLDLQGQLRREKTPGLFGEHTGTSYNLSLAAAYELDLWQKIANQERAAGLDRDATAAETQTLLLSLSARLADLYYLAAEQRSQLQLTDANIAAFADTLARVESRYRQGLVPALDVYQARQNLDAARARRPQFERGLALAEHALAVLLGNYPGDLPAASLIELPETPAAFPAGLPSELLARRPDVGAALLRVAAADARLAAAVAERFPSFNLLAGYGYSRTAFVTGDLSGTFWNLIFNAAQPLFDAGRRKAEVARHEALVRERLAAYHGQVLAAFQEVEDALAANRTSEEQIVRLAAQRRTTEAALRLALDGYLAGLSDYLPVLAAQSAQLDSDSRLLEARRRLISDRISLARALGGAWMADTLDQRLAADAGRQGNDQP
ncbi:efflux transporter outer membrane subunit [Geoalkalibacter halelectricus]|uniref:efflux transporter outer membrane subunit n=1 Tax=Geoalkalibacter halelectricus TaxID=2847045 RepID=UPI003D22D9A2